MLYSSVFHFCQFLKSSFIVCSYLYLCSFANDSSLCFNGDCNFCSRSQCIINIRWGSKQGGEEVDGDANYTTLTIVDLAGAEREKKTGNQVLVQSISSMQVLYHFKQLGYE